MEIKSDGKWWFPKENIQQPGTLIFNENEASLTIAGPFLPSMENYSTRDKKDFIILGELADRRKITLIAFNRGSGQESLGQQYVYSKTEFQLNFIILGAHFQNVEDIKFESILVEYSNLENWFRFDLDDKSLKIKVGDESISSISYHKTIDVSINNLCSLQIFQSEKVAFEQFTNESEVSNKIYVKIGDMRKNNLEDCLVLMETFRDFLNFIIMEEIKTISFKGMIKTESGRDDLLNVNVIWVSSLSSKLGKMPNNICHFRFNEIKDQFGQVVNAWFNFKKELTIVYELYSGVMNNPELYLINKFLMISEAIEVYHRLKFDSKNITKEQKDLYEKIVTLITDVALNSNVIGSSEIEQVKTWMRNGISPYLSTRIMQLYEKYSDIIQYISLKIGSKKCFSLKVSKYRNDLTHGNLSGEEIDDSDLYWTYSDLQLLLRLSILSELGFSTDNLHTFCHTKSTRPQYNMKELLQQKINITLGFFDRNTETAFLWSTQLTDLCDIPGMKVKDPNLLLKIIEGVEECVNKERDIDIEEKKNKGVEVTEDELSNYPHDNLEKLTENRKSKFFDKIYLINKQHFSNLPRNEVIGVSLALWSGCRSAVKTLSKEENGGPKPDIRGLVFQMIEKLSHERSIFGWGVEIALLWKTSHGEGNDVEFKEEVIEPRIKKHEKLWNQKPM